MGIYEAIAERLKKEDDKKKKWTYEHFGCALTTRFFPTGEAYPEKRVMNFGEPLSPTMVTPWGKVLGPKKNNSVYSEQAFTSQATFVRALKSILAQFLYDIANTIFYAIIAIPCLIVGASYIAYAFGFEENEENKKQQIQFAQEKCLGNVVLVPYFAAAIVIDFLREFRALFSRSYATIMQTDKEKQNLHWCYSR